jgi:hypothetical protein
MANKLSEMEDVKDSLKLAEKFLREMKDIVKESN